MHCTDERRLLQSDRGRRRRRASGREGRVIKQSLSVSIEREAVTIRVPSLTHETGDEYHQLPLEYYVRPEVLWSIDALYSHQDIIYPPSKDSSSSRSRGVGTLSPGVILSKAPSVEWFPGCEWWSNVCIGDENRYYHLYSEPDTSELPVEARLRAQKEHTRFTDQVKKSERGAEGPSQIRKDVGKAVQSRRRQSKRPTERSRRGEMLGALSEVPTYLLWRPGQQDKDKDKDKGEGERAGGYICRAIVQLLQRVYRCHHYNSFHG